MKAEDLRLEELVSFSDGLVSLHGRRLIIHDIHAMAQLRRDLVETVGLEQSRRIFSRFGFYWGEADAAAMKRIMKWDSVEEWLKAGPRLHALQGVMDAELKVLQLGDGGKLRMEVIWNESAEAEEQLLELGASPDAGCWIQLGYASGYATLCLGRPVYFTERTCRGRGDRVCIAEGMDADSWGDQAELLAGEYKVDDIKGKIQELTTTVHKKTLELARHKKRLKQVEIGEKLGMSEIKSKSFQQVLDVGKRVAKFDTSVLITGESGVGKEVVARFVHNNSPRRSGPFLAVNCGALPETLLESELFGHKSGSFTGAVRDRQGLFEEANGGTLLLDEIGDITPALQIKLLRVLQEKQIRRVGENKVRDIDVRIIAATNRMLQDDLRDGRFREDLFYRLRVVEIHIPPLRERTEDILPLARLFTERLLTRLKLRRLTLHASCLPDLERYSWPGNVRELENAMERAAVMSEDGWIHAEHLPDAIREGTGAGYNVEPGTPRSLQEIEFEHIRRVLGSVDGNRTRAAKILNISPTTLWRKLKEIGDTV